MSGPTAPPPTPSACLAALASADAARPRLTSVRPDGRVDLSAATLANWVAKTAHLLRDDLGAGPGDTVGLCLPRHWLAAVWLLAADCVGATLRVAAAEDPDALETLLAGAGPAPLAVLVGPGGDAGEAGPAPAAVAAAADPLGCEVLVASLRPFALPATDGLPGTARDLTDAVRPFPDTPAAVEPDGDLPLLRLADGSQATRREVQAAAGEHAARAGWAEGVRLLAEGPVTAEALVTGLLAPWAVRGSAVWLGNLEPAAVVSLVEQERITARA